MSTPAFRRIVRRETHSPRTVAMFIAVILLILALVYVGVEIVLYLLAQPALLLGPGAALGWIVGLPTAQPAGLVILGGVVLAVLGLVFLVLGLGPGRLPKHEMSGDRRAVVVDNGVIASSLAQRISEETGIQRDDITVGVSHRTVDVTVRSGFGDPHEKEPIARVVDAELERYALIPSVTSRVRVTSPPERDQDR
ncbi:DUF6286 domain-containing protein [Microbacterium pygmaeum]|uniref:DUF6286 domain-containing protein n=1 Tax=Microbacterium pygmaeum TaxID=370764 RepID=A0A1G7WLZ2_9MICO|nr:DUF6286 domain-containing protein [Microbacterium pygmaeum]SDG73007.1 hypothetical protein SAMN04489810_1130 [Microbacterium pygmaeum]